MDVTPTHLIERFYHEVWNQADERVAHEILHTDFQFRGSLGPEKRGPEGFVEYMRSVHKALGGYTCTIVSVVEEGQRAAARMEFRGIHRDVFYGVPASGREIRWAGAAFFQTDGAQITALWVLGDIDGVKAQLGASASPAFE